MKRIMLFIFISLILFIVFPKGEKVKLVHSKDSYHVIPDEAIRLRILSNSNDEVDQELKYLIRDEVNAQITSWVEHFTSIQTARKIIQNRLPEIIATVERVLVEAGSTYSADVHYDQNISFPLKMYDSIIYPPGEYEAILVTLGEGKGSNWWCVLFPPLCFLDFSNSAPVADEGLNDQAEENNEEDEPVKVKFFLFEWLGWT